MQNSSTIRICYMYVLLGGTPVGYVYQHLIHVPIVFRSASQQEQIFLRALVAEFQRTGIEEAPFSKVFQQHVSLCRIEGSHSFFFCGDEGINLHMMHYLSI